MCLQQIPQSSVFQYHNSNYENITAETKPSNPVRLSCLGEKLILLKTYLPDYHVITHLPRDTSCPNK